MSGKKDKGADKRRSYDALAEAHKIAFAPLMYQAARSLRDLGILALIQEAGSHGMSPEKIAEKTELSEYGVEVLLDAGISMELVMMRNGKYVLAKTGYFLQNDEMARVNMDFSHHFCYQAMFYLEDSVRNRRAEGLKLFGEGSTIYPLLPRLGGKVKESWHRFDHFYSDMSFPDILPVIMEAGPRKILDVGGNQAKFAILCAQSYPEVEITIADLGDTLLEALGKAEEKGLQQRIKGIAVNMLDESQSLPSGFGAILMSQFLDCFSKDQIVSILRRTRESMGDNTVLFILELFWDRQEHPAASYCLNAISLYFTCIANGNSRIYHSEDFIGLVRKAGLVIGDVNDIPGTSHTLIKCTRG